MDHLVLRLLGPMASGAVMRGSVLALPGNVYAAVVCMLPPFLGWLGILKSFVTAGAPLLAVFSFLLPDWATQSAKRNLSPGWRRACAHRS